MGIDTEKRRNRSEIALRSTVYRFDGVEVDVAAGRVRKDGVEVPLRLKTWDVLLTLLENRHRIVGKDELREVVWGDAVVDDDGIVQCVVDIRKALDDDSRNPRYVRTVPKVGYRFVAELEELVASPPAFTVVEEVRSVQIEVTEEDAEEAESAPVEVKALPPSTTFRRRLLPLLAVLVTAAGFFTFLSLRDRGVATRLASAPGRKSVAVLLFENQSSDRELDWMREGLADMLVADLSGSSRLNILSRQQLHVVMNELGASPGRRLPLPSAVALARRTRADAFLLGGFTRLGDRIRVQAQLHDGAGALLAAESVTAERPEQVFTQVDRLAGKMLGHLGAAEPGVWPSPGIVLARTGSLPAYRLYALALEKAEAFKTTEALELLKRAIEVDPGFAMAHARLGFVYVFTWGKAEEGKPHLERAFRLSDRLTDVERLAIQAWYAVACGDFARAIVSMRKLVALDPRDTESAVRLAGLLRGELRAAEAVAVLEAACANDPDSTLARNMLGGAYSDLGRHDEAIAWARRSLALAPGEPNAHDTLGYFLQWSGRYEEALASYRKALELEPRFDIAQVHLGNTLFQMGRRREAIAVFEEYLRLAPSDQERARAYESLALAHYRRGALEEAWAAAREKVKLKALVPVGTEVLIAWDRGDAAEAERLAVPAGAEPLRISRGTRASRCGDYATLGALRLKQGRVDEGLAELRRALEEGPFAFNLETYLGCLAEALVALRRWDEAIAECERILRLNPHEPMALYRLGIARAAKGETNRARDALTRFLAVWKDADPDVPELAEARRRLRALS